MDILDIIQINKLILKKTTPYKVENFNEGRSKSFFSIATALLPIKDLERGLKKCIETVKNENTSLKDLKAKFKIPKEKIKEIADKEKRRRK